MCDQAISTVHAVGHPLVKTKDNFSSQFMKRENMIPYKRATSTTASRVTHYINTTECIVVADFKSVKAKRVATAGIDCFNYSRVDILRIYGLMGIDVGL